MSATVVGARNQAAADLAAGTNEAAACRAIRLQQSFALQAYLRQLATPGSPWAALLDHALAGIPAFLDGRPDRRLVSDLCVYCGVAQLEEHHTGCPSRGNFDR